MVEYVTGNPPVGNDLETLVKIRISQRIREIFRSYEEKEDSSSAALELGLETGQVCKLRSDKTQNQARPRRLHKAMSWAGALKCCVLIEMAE